MPVLLEQTFKRRNASWQISTVGGHAKERRRAGGADVQIFIEEVRQAGSQVVHADEENCFKFQALDVLDVENTNVIVLTDRLPARAGDSADAALGQRFIKGRSQWNDLLFVVHEDGN